MKLKGGLRRSFYYCGTGYVADKNYEKAKEANVPLHEDSKLAKTLSKLEIGEAIPPELYGVVAEILVFVDDMEKLKKKINRQTDLKL